MHRETSVVHDLGSENWHNCTRAQRIRKGVPSKLTLTMFGQAPSTESTPVPGTESMPIAVPSGAPVEPSTGAEPPSAVRASGSQNLPLAVHARSSNTVCEGWAPPPVPLHGPKFRLLKDSEKQDLIKVHKNLGHPDPNVLSQHLKLNGAEEHIVEAAREYICDACVETSKFKHQRPAKLHEPREFNELVGIDGFFWTGRKGFQVMIFHCIDEASLFHLGRRLENRHLEHVLPAFTEFWFSWAGQPRTVYSDPAGEFRADQWLEFMQKHDIETKLSTEAWQKGRVEQHGQIIKNMLHRYDQEKIIEGPTELDQVLRACFQAKNALSRHQGFSPEQIVLGKSTRLPASLSSDENASAHCLADGSDLECERFQRNLEARSQARKMFLLADNDASIRRAILRKSNPHPGIFVVGQSVMYWRKKQVSGRREVGRWHGPARIVCSEGDSNIWVSHGDRLLRCAPENLRPASLREWHGSNVSLDQQVTEIQQSQNVNQTLSTRQEEHTAMLPEQTYSPGTPLQEPNDTVSHQTSVQPESEEFPEQLITPINTSSQHSQQELMEPNASFDNLPEGNEDNAIDLDEFSLSADQSAEIMTCHDLCSSEEIESIHEWNSFQPGVENCDICLAEDGLPYLNEPVQPHDHQCYLLEVPLSRQDIVRWSQSERPEELAQVASASKRARAEVQLKDLSAEDKKLFSLAKEAEISCWLQTSA